MNKKTTALTILSLLVIITLPVWLDAETPGWWYTVELRMLPGVAVWMAALSIVVEYPFVRLLFGFRVVEAVCIDIVMNVISTLLVYLFPSVCFLASSVLPGPLEYLFQPIFRLSGAVLPGPLVLALLHWRTFNPIIWAVTCLLAVSVTAGLQSMIVQTVLNAKIGKKGFSGLFAANLTSLGVASVSFLLKNPGPY